MFLLYWKVYVLMVVAVNFLNEDLHWFCGKKTLIDGGVYMCLNGSVGSMWFCILGYIGTSVQLVRVNVAYIMCFFYCVGNI